MDEFEQRKTKTKMKNKFACERAKHSPMYGEMKKPLFMSDSNRFEFM